MEPTFDFQLNTYWLRPEMVDISRGESILLYAKSQIKEKINQTSYKNS